jgi:hypothetical protein
MFSMGSVSKFIRDPDDRLQADYITKLCRRQAEVIQNHANEHVRGIGQGEARQKI